jgi:hypothetical protein
MALRKPLVAVNGVISQIPAGDTLLVPMQGLDSISMNNGEAGAITIGMPVYVSAADTVKKGQANASGTRIIAGLVADASVAAAASGVIATSGPLTSADWTSVTGSATLTSGALYFLDASTAGKLTATAPTTTGQFVVCVGIAIDTTTLLIDLNPATAIAL